MEKLLPPTSGVILENLNQSAGSTHTQIRGDINQNIHTAYALLMHQDLIYAYPDAAAKRNEIFVELEKHYQILKSFTECVQTITKMLDISAATLIDHPECYRPQGYHNSPISEVAGKTRLANVNAQPAADVAKYIKDIIDEMETQPKNVDPLFVYIEQMTSRNGLVAVVEQYCDMYEERLAKWHKDVKRTLVQVLSCFNTIKGQHQAAEAEALAWRVLENKDAFNERLAQVDKLLDA